MQNDVLQVKIMREAYGQVQRLTAELLFNIMEHRRHVISVRYSTCGNTCFLLGQWFQFQLRSALVGRSVLAAGDGELLSSQQLPNDTD